MEPIKLEFEFFIMDGPFGAYHCTVKQRDGDERITCFAPSPSEALRGCFNSLLSEVDHEIQPSQ